MARSLARGPSVFHVADRAVTRKQERDDSIGADLQVQDPPEPRARDGEELIAVRRILGLLRRERHEDGSLAGRELDEAEPSLLLHEVGLATGQRGAPARGPRREAAVAP